MIRGGVDMLTWTMSISFVVIICIWVWYVYVGRYMTDYRKAKKEIIAYVQSYKKRCTSNNRFVVTVESLQDSFREYDVQTIEKVWLDLVNSRIIERDPKDQEWCVR